jgi:ribosomal protein L37E
MAKIRCQRCGREQTYHGQSECDHCEVRLNNWSVASQLALQPKNNDEESDGA